MNTDNLKQSMMEIFDHIAEKVSKLDVEDKIKEEIILSTYITAIKQETAPDSDMMTEIKSSCLAICDTVLNTHARLHDHRILAVTSFVRLSKTFLNSALAYVDIDMYREYEKQVRKEFNAFVYGWTDKFGIHVSDS